MATRTPLMAITAVHALCNIAKTMLDQLSSLGSKYTISSLNGPVLDGCTSAWSRTCSVICQLAGFLAAKDGLLLRAGSAAFDPGFHLRHCFGTRDRRWSAPVARIPSPADQIIGRYMLQ